MSEFVKICEARIEDCSYLRYESEDKSLFFEYLYLLGEVEDKTFDSKINQWIIPTSIAYEIQKKIKEMDIGAEMKLSPFSYQKKAIRFGLNKKNTLFKLPCGAGKTVIGIGLASELNRLDKIKPPFLMVTKAALKNQWASEIEKFSNLKPVILQTYDKSVSSFSSLIKKEEDKIVPLLKKAMKNNKKISEIQKKINELKQAAEKKFKEQFDAEVYVANYETLNDEKVRQAIIEKGTQFVFADEVQCIKDDAALRSKSLCNFNEFEYRFGATATPIKKNMEDLYGLFHLINKDIFGERKDFNRNYLKYGKFKQIAGYKNTKVLLGKVKPYIFSMTEEELGKALPTLTPPIIRYCDLTEKQRLMTNTLMEEIQQLKEEERRLYAKKGGNIDPKTDPELQKLQGQIMARQTFAQQLADSEELLKESDSGMAKHYITGSSSSKLDLLMNILEEILESEEKVCIFSRYLHMQKIIEDAVKKKAKSNSAFNVKIANITGVMDAKTKYENVYDKFQGDDDYKILLCSDAGNEGLNLTKCRYLIEYEPADSEANQQQRHGRIRRADSIYRTVFVYQLIARESYDEIAQKIISKKEKYAASIEKGHLEGDE